VIQVALGGWVVNPAASHIYSTNASRLRSDWTLNPDGNERWDFPLRREAIASPAQRARPAWCPAARLGTVGSALCPRPAPLRAGTGGGVFQPLQAPASAASRCGHRGRRSWPPAKAWARADTAVHTSLSDFTQSRQRFDVILDNVLNHPPKATARVLASKGLLMPNSIGYTGGLLAGLPRTARAVLMGFGPTSVRLVTPAVNRENLDALGRLLEPARSGWSSTRPTRSTKRRAP
jgi:hypothetical protein